MSDVGVLAAAAQHAFNTVANGKSASCIAFCQSLLPEDVAAVVAAMADPVRAEVMRVAATTTMRDKSFDELNPQFILGIGMKLPGEHKVDFGTYFDAACKARAARPPTDATGVQKRKAKEATQVESPFKKSKERPTEQAAEAEQPPAEAEQPPAEGGQLPDVSPDVSDGGSDRGSDRGSDSKSVDVDVVIY